MKDLIFEKEYGDLNISICYKCLKNNKMQIFCEKHKQLFDDHAMPCFFLKSKFRDLLAPDNMDEFKKIKENKEAVLDKLNSEYQFDDKTINVFIKKCENKINQLEDDGG